MNETNENAKHRMLHITSSHFNDKGQIDGGFLFTAFYVQEENGRVGITIPTNVENIELRSTHKILKDYVKITKKNAEENKDKPRVKVEENPEAKMVNSEDGGKHFFITLQDTFFSNLGCPEYTANVCLNFHETQSGLFKVLFNSNVDINAIENIVNEFRRLIDFKEANEQERYEESHPRKADA